MGSEGFGSQVEIDTAQEQEVPASVKVMIDVLTGMALNPASDTTEKLLLGSGQNSDFLAGYQPNTDFRDQVLFGKDFTREEVYITKGLKLLGGGKEKLKTVTSSLTDTQREERILSVLPKLEQSSPEAQEAFPEFLGRILNELQVNNREGIKLFSSDGKLTPEGQLTVFESVERYFVEAVDVTGKGYAKALNYQSGVLEEYREVLASSDTKDLPRELVELLTEAELAVNLVSTQHVANPDLGIHEVVYQAIEQRKTVTEVSSPDLVILQEAAKKVESLQSKTLIPTQAAGKTKILDLPDGGGMTVEMAYRFANMTFDSDISKAAKEALKQINLDTGRDKDSALGIFDLQNVARVLLRDKFTEEQQLIVSGDLDSAEASLAEMSGFQDDEIAAFFFGEKEMDEGFLSRLTPAQRKTIQISLNTIRLTGVVAAAFTGTSAALALLEDNQESDFTPLDFSGHWGDYHEAISGHGDFDDPDVMPVAGMVVQNKGGDSISDQDSEAIPFGLSSLKGQDLEGNHPNIDNVRDVMEGRSPEQTNADSFIAEGELPSVAERDGVENAPNWGVLRTDDSDQKLNYEEPVSSVLDDTDSMQAAQYGDNLEAEQGNEQTADMDSQEAASEIQPTETTHIALPGDALTEEQWHRTNENYNNFFQIKHGETPSHAFHAMGLNNTDIFGEDGESGVWQDLIDGDSVAIYNGQAYVMIYDDPTTPEETFKVINSDSSVDGTPAGAILLRIDLPAGVEINDPSAQIVEPLREILASEDVTSENLTELVFKIEQGLQNEDGILDVNDVKLLQSDQETDTIEQIINSVDPGVITPLSTLDGITTSPTAQDFYNVINGENSGVVPEDYFTVIDDQENNIVVRHDNEDGSGIFITFTDDNGDGTYDPYIMRFEDAEEGNRLQLQFFPPSGEQMITVPNFNPIDHQPTDHDYYEIIEREKAPEGDVLEGYDINHVYSDTGVFVVRHNESDGSGSIVKVLDGDGDGVFESASIFSFATVEQGNEFENNLITGIQLEENDAAIDSLANISIASEEIEREMQSRPTGVITTANIPTEGNEGDAIYESVTGLTLPDNTTIVELFQGKNVNGEHFLIKDLGNGNILILHPVDVDSDGRTDHVNFVIAPIDGVDEKINELLNLLDQSIEEETETIRDEEANTTTNGPSSAVDSTIENTESGLEQQVVTEDGGISVVENSDGSSTYSTTLLFDQDTGDYHIVSSEEQTASSESFVVEINIPEDRNVSAEVVADLIIQVVNDVNRGNYEDSQEVLEQRIEEVTQFAGWTFSDIKAYLNSEDLDEVTIGGIAYNLNGEGELVRTTRYLPTAEIEPYNNALNFAYPVTTEQRLVGEEFSSREVSETISEFNAPFYEATVVEPSNLPGFLYNQFDEHTVLGDAGNEELIDFVSSVSPSTPMSDAITFVNGVAETVVRVNDDGDLAVYVFYLVDPDAEGGPILVEEYSGNIKENPAGEGTVVVSVLLSQDWIGKSTEELRTKIIETVNEPGFREELQSDNVGLLGQSLEVEGTLRATQIPGTGSVRNYAGVNSDFFTDDETAPFGIMTVNVDLDGNSDTGEARVTYGIVVFDSEENGWRIIDKEDVSSDGENQMVEGLFPQVIEISRQPSNSTDNPDVEKALEQLPVPASVSELLSAGLSENVINDISGLLQEYFLAGNVRPFSTWGELIDGLGLSERENELISLIKDGVIVLPRTDGSEVTFFVGDPNLKWSSSGTESDRHSTFYANAAPNLDFDVNSLNSETPVTNYRYYSSHESAFGVQVFPHSLISSIVNGSVSTPLDITLEILQAGGATTNGTISHVLNENIPLGVSFSGGILYQDQDTEVIQLVLLDGDQLNKEEYVVVITDPDGSGSGSVHTLIVQLTSEQSTELKENGQLSAESIESVLETTRNLIDGGFVPTDQADSTTGFVPIIMGSGSNDAATTAEETPAESDVPKMEKDVVPQPTTQGTTTTEEMVPTASETATPETAQTVISEPTAQATPTATPESEGTSTGGATPQPTPVPETEIDGIYTQVDPDAVIFTRENLSEVSLPQLNVNGTAIANFGFSEDVDIFGLVDRIVGTMSISMSNDIFDWKPTEIQISVGDLFKEQILQRSSVATTPLNYSDEKGFASHIIAFLGNFEEDVDSAKGETLEGEVRNLLIEELSQLVVQRFTLSFLDPSLQNYTLGENIREALAGIGLEDGIHDSDIPGLFRTGQLAPWSELIQHAVLERAPELYQQEEWDGLSDSGYVILVPNTNGEVVEYDSAIQALSALNNLIMDIIGQQAVQEIEIPAGVFTDHLYSMGSDIIKVYTDPTILNLIQGKLEEKGFNIFELIGIRGTDSEDKLRVEVSNEVLQEIQNTVTYPYDLSFDELLESIGVEEQSSRTYIPIDSSTLEKLHIFLEDSVISTDKGKFVPVREVTDSATGLPGFVFDNNAPTHLAPINLSRGVTPEQIMDNEISSYEFYATANSDGATFIRAIPVGESGLTIDTQRLAEVLEDGKVGMGEIFELIYPIEQRNDWPEGLYEPSQAWGDLIEIEFNSQNIQFLRIKTVNSGGMQNNTFLTVYTSAEDNAPFLIEGKMHGATSDNTAFLTITISEDEIPEDREQLASLLNEKFEVEAQNWVKNSPTPTPTATNAPTAEPNETVLPGSETGYYGGQVISSGFEGSIDWTIQSGNDEGGAFQVYVNDPSTEGNFDYTISVIFPSDEDPGGIFQIIKWETNGHVPEGSLIHSGTFQGLDPKNFPDLPGNMFEAIFELENKPIPTATPTSTQTTTATVEATATPLPTSTVETIVSSTQESPLEPVEEVSTPDGSNQENAADNPPEVEEVARPNFLKTMGLAGAAIGGTGLLTAVGIRLYNRRKRQEADEALRDNMGVDKVVWDNAKKKFTGNPVFYALGLPAVLDDGIVFSYSRRDTIPDLMNKDVYIVKSGGLIRKQVSMDDLTKTQLFSRQFLREVPARQGESSLEVVQDTEESWIHSSHNVTISSLNRIKREMNGAGDRLPILGGLLSADFPDSFWGLIGEAHSRETVRVNGREAKNVYEIDDPDEIRKLIGAVIIEQFEVVDEAERNYIFESREIPGLEGSEIRELVIKEKPGNSNT